jgi:hypothetical protein
MRNFPVKRVWSQVLKIGTRSRSSLR